MRWIATIILFLVGGCAHQQHQTTVSVIYSNGPGSQVQIMHTISR